jgi:hypothetical protein
VRPHRISHWKIRRPLHMACHCGCLYQQCHQCPPRAFHSLSERQTVASPDVRVNHAMQWQEAPPIEGA